MASPSAEPRSEVWSVSRLPKKLASVMFGRALGIIIDVMKVVVPEKSPSEIAGPVMMPVLMDFVSQNPEYLEVVSGN